MNQLPLQHELNQLYARTEHSISDYAFFEDEIKFLINLVDHFFVGPIISSPANIYIVQGAASRLLELDKERESIARENQGEAQ